MEVRNIRWVGVPTENYAAMRALLEQVMGLRLSFEEPTTVEFTTTEGDEVQLHAPGDPYFDFFKRHATGPVPLFEVDDVHTARVELDENGIAIVGDLGQDGRWEWIHFRAPDGQSVRARQQARERLGAPAAGDFFEAPAEALVVLGEVVEARELGEPC
jgi:catechol 2,3-dioxygenase-like lactoylglutathione lyase family enzyme